MAEAAVTDAGAEPKKVKWGILSTADIARKFCAAIPDASNATIVAVASRSKAKAEAFIEANCPGAKACESYDELLEDPEVQAVYIPLPTALRPEWVLKAAGNGKHVLSEKPLSVKARDAQQVTQSCSAAGVQFMDNTMFMHHERTAAIREIIDDKELFGTPSKVVSTFFIPFASGDDWDNIRMSRDTEPLGCLGDLGWYCARISLFAFGWADPTQVSCTFSDTTSGGVPTQASATLVFSGGRTAVFDCSFKHAVAQWAEIYSEKAVLRVEDFVIPAELGKSSFTVKSSSFGDRARTVPVETLVTKEINDCCQELKLIEKFSSLVLEGKVDPFWPKVALQTQLLMNGLVSSARYRGAQIDYMSSGKDRSKGTGKGKGQKVDRPKTKPVISKVEVIEPDGKNLNLEVKVVSVEASAEGATAVVGDATGVVSLVVSGEAQMALVKEGASLVIRNAAVKMAKGFITLIVDKWGKVEASEEAFEFTPAEKNNVSKTEYELVQTWEVG